MALKGCSACIKYLVFVFNLLFWLTGLIMVGIGVWAIADPNIASNLGQDNEEFAKTLQTLSVVVIIVGGVIMITGFFGCCGAIRESQCCLSLFFFVLLLIFIILVTCGIFALIFTSNEDLKQAFKDSMKTVIINDINSSDDSPENKKLTAFESLLKCCGDVGHIDYKEQGKDLSKSCSNAITSRAPQVAPGCTEELLGVWKQHGVIVGAVIIAVAFLVLVGMIFACTLCCAIRRNREYVDDY